MTLENMSWIDKNNLDLSLLIHFRPLDLLEIKCNLILN